MRVIRDTAFLQPDDVEEVFQTVFDLLAAHVGVYVRNFSGLLIDSL